MLTSRGLGLMSLLWLASACDGDTRITTVTTSRLQPPASSAPLDAGLTDTSVVDATSDVPSSPDTADVLDATAPDVETGGPGVQVSHQRELRAIWVATVWNINFPSRAGLTPAQLRAELDALVDVTEAAGLNAIIFQVRAEGDAFYASNVEPWSRFLTGTQGQDPGLDPLAYLLERAHARAIEVHAWLNPYRARTSRTAPLAPSHLAALHPELNHNYGSSLVWMDPGALIVQQRLLDVVADLVTSYPLDGIHFDDYFYPYPDGPFPDDATYAAYTAAGGTLARDDWRRDNVNRMVAAVHALVRDLDPACRFGISPFGIYRPEHPPGIRGLDQYAAIFADPVRWMLDGHVDYIAPQLYWPTTRTAQAYEPLLRWWTEVAPGTHVFAGNYLSQLGSSDDWTIAELREQLRLSRAMRSGSSLGNIWYQIGPLLENRQGIRDIFAEEFYPTPALPPALPGAAPVTPPQVRRGAVAGDWTLTHTAPSAEVFAAALYEAEGDDWHLRRVLPASTTELTLEGSGPWAVTTIARGGAESLGAIINP